MRALLRSGWPGAVGVVVVVVIFGGLALTLVAGAMRTLSAPDRYERSLHNQFDVSLSQQQGLPLTAEISRLPAVHTVDMAVFTFGGLIPAHKTQPADTLIFSGSTDAFVDRLVEGRTPRATAPSARTLEFVTTKSFAAATHTGIGSRFRLVTVTRRQAEAHGFDARPTGPRFTAVLVGLIDGPAELSDDYKVAVF